MSVREYHCVKVPYRSPHEAMRHAALLYRTRRKGQKKGRLRAYLCSNCGHYHLTSARH